MKLFTFLLGAVGPLAIRVLSAVGFTAVTFTGVQAVVNQLIGLAQTHWSEAPAGVIQLASLAGIPEGLGLICGAFVARLTLWLAAQATKLIFTGKAA